MAESVTVKPSILVAVGRELRREFFAAADLARCGEFADALGGELATVESMAEAFDDPALDLSSVRVVVIAWGAPMFDDALLERLPSLQVIAHTGSSVKPFVGPSVFARGIRITQAGAAMARSVAEVSLTFTLILLHRIGRFDHALRAGAPWKEAQRGPEQHELLAEPIGVVGASRTGRAYLELLLSLGARPLVHDPTLDDDAAIALGAEPAPLDDLLARSRIVALHAPTLPETHHMIGRRELSLMRDGSGLVNTARSWLVDEEALVDELRTGRIDAAIDVFDEEPLPTASILRRLPNVVLSPHRAAGTRQGRLRQGSIVVSELERFVAGAPLQHEVMQADLARMA